MSLVFSAREAADLLGVHLDTLYDWLARGAISGMKVRGRWLIPKGPLLRFLAEHAPAAGDSSGDD